MVLVVVLLSVANDRSGFVNVVEAIHIEALIALTTVKGLDVPVAPGLNWWDVVNAELASN